MLIRNENVELPQSDINGCRRAFNQLFVCQYFCLFHQTCHEIFFLIDFETSIVFSSSVRAAVITSYFGCCNLCIISSSHVGLPVNHHLL